MNTKTQRPIGYIHPQNVLRLQKGEAVSVRKDGWAGEPQQMPVYAYPVPEDKGYEPMDTAPKDGHLVMLLVEFESGNLEDDPDPHWTIGFNTLSDTGDDEWHMAGWCWNHDHFTGATGKIVGWKPYRVGMTDAEKEQYNANKS